MSYGAAADQSNPVTLLDRIYDRNTLNQSFNAPSAPAVCVTTPHTGHVRLLHNPPSTSPPPPTPCDVFCWLWLSLPEGTHPERWHDMLQPSAVSSRGEDTLTGRGITAASPLTPPHPPKSTTSFPFGKKNSNHHTHTQALLTKPNRGNVTDLWCQSVYQNVSNLCWRRPSISGYQQTQTLVQSGKGRSAPGQSRHKLTGLKMEG